MNLSEQTKCNQCLRHFNPNNLAFSMVNCKHNICSKCLTQIWDNENGKIQCEFCDNVILDCKDMDFKENQQLMKKIKSGILKHESNTQSSNSRNQSFKIENGSGIDQDDENLLASLTPACKKIEDQQKNKFDDICPIHEKQLEIICTTDLKMICPHCAIFGNHKDHKFKTIKEFNKDFQEKCQLLQIIQKQKYITDKKIRPQEFKESVQAQIANRKKQLIQKIQNKFLSLMQEIKKAQVKVYQELQKNFQTIQAEINNITNQKNKIQVQFSIWEAECEDIITKIQEDGDFNQKINLMYGSLKKIDIGPEIVEKLQKRNLMQTKKIHNILASVSVQFPSSISFSNLAKIVKKSEEKKECFTSMIEKINIPSGKHIIDDIQDFQENSFICDISKEDLSLILQGEVKKGTKNKNSKNIDPLNQTTNIKSPKVSCRKYTNAEASKQKLMRSKSNYLLPEDKKNPSRLIPCAQKKPIMSRSRIKETGEKKDPQTVMKQFIKQDLKEVLDLSRCELNDDNVYDYLKQVRKHRKIRGLKLCQNDLSDVGFSRIMQFLNSTTNLNLSYNKMTQEVLNLLSKNKDKFAPLRIINLSFNNVNEKKAKMKIDALKKQGIIINL